MKLMKLLNGVVLGGLTVLSSGVSAAGADKSTTALDESDVKMLAEMHKSNLAESAHGKLARASAATPGVRAYGKTLQNDHDAADKKLMALIAKRKVDRTDFDARVNTLESKGRDMAGAEKIHSAKGAEFDRVFTSHMAEHHERMLEKVNAALEQTHDRDMKQLLARVKPVLERHQKVARNLMASYSAAGGSENGAGRINTTGTGSTGNQPDGIGTGTGSRGTGTGNSGPGTGSSGTGSRGAGGSRGTGGMGSSGTGPGPAGNGTGNHGTGGSRGTGGVGGSGTGPGIGAAGSAGRNPLQGSPGAGTDNRGTGTGAGAGTKGAGSLEGVPGHKAP